MHRIVFIAIAGSLLAGCSSVSDAFKPAPQTASVRLESTPPGATATTSIGPSCQTPCELSLPITTAEEMTVDFSLAKHQPQTVAAMIVRQPGDVYAPGAVSIDPNPIVAQLVPEKPARRTRKNATPARAAAPQTAPTAEVAPPTAAPRNSVFPPPPPSR